MWKTKVYSDLKKAEKLLWKRRRDPKIQKKVEDFIGGVLPAPFLKEPRAVIARQIATPNFEFSLFMLMALGVGLRPLVLEYQSDKFNTNNEDKLGLAKLKFHRHEMMGNRGEKTYAVINMQQNENKVLSSIKTKWNESLVDFHHELFSHAYPGVEIANAPDWPAFSNKKPTEIYDKFLALFVCNGVLFENFVISDSSRDFFDAIVSKAYKNVSRVIGCEPIIVKLDYRKFDLENKIWNYSEYLEPLISERDNGNL